MNGSAYKQTSFQRKSLFFLHNLSSQSIESRLKTWSGLWTVPSESVANLLEKSHKFIHLSQQIPSNVKFIIRWTFKDQSNSCKLFITEIISTTMFFWMVKTT